MAAEFWRRSRSPLCDSPIDEWRPRRRMYNIAAVKGPAARMLRHPGPHMQILNKTR
eukprot:CAMPEP_0170298282 /NCGR_PEP_ID=MMETSP0116_2-20130129/49316_1 /TAXON_ID=400756 /ORGANISM="Durinskia baltica, Strain CSIRO CS-38" /LENGTH=55 /DNA_ID=CAMNT_0010549935 /DNA_START=79 /DNA_END=243 /DNA_ORIENTATION=+